MDDLNTTSHKQLYISDYTSSIVSDLILAALVAVISIFGVVSNCINVVVFYKQGVFTENGTTTMFVLGIADLGYSTIMVFYCCFQIIDGLNLPDLPFVAFDMVYVIIWPAITFQQVSRIIMAYLSLERCASVALPFFVGNLFTPKRSLIFTGCAFLITFSLFIPLYLAYPLSFVMDRLTNATKLRVVINFKIHKLAHEIYNINNLAFNSACIIIVFICTAVIIIKINLSKAWRESVSLNAAKHPNKTKGTADSKISTSVKSVTKAGDNNIANDKNPNLDKKKISKEKKLVNMIVVICVIFLICYLPELMYRIAQRFEPELFVKSEVLGNLAGLFVNFLSIGQGINSSVNILVYYRMSSKYRQHLNALIDKRSV